MEASLVEEESEVPQQVADLAEASVPNALRGIRACKRCGILKTLDQFINEGTLRVVKHSVVNGGCFLFPFFLLLIIIVYPRICFS
tara:strand:- start:311 stop:565 length:255 start_codon:yes stop_codon:yes gene_type:complete